MEEIKNYTFVKVEVVPPTDEAYFQLYIDDKPTSYIFSYTHLTHLARCCEFLNSAVYG